MVGACKACKREVAEGLSRQADPLGHLEASPKPGGEGQTRAWLIQAGGVEAWLTGPWRASLGAPNCMGASLNSCWISRCICQLDSSTLGGAREVVIPLLQVVQTGIDLVQHAVDGGIHCLSSYVVVLAFGTHIHSPVPHGSRQGGLVHMQDSRDVGVRPRWVLGLPFSADPLF